MWIIWGAKVKKISLLLVLSFFIYLVLPLNYSEAATTVKTKVHTYKGQQYVQITGGNKAATNKINKALKVHAVNAAKWDRENKLDDKNYWYKTVASTKYSKNERLSVVYTDALYNGGIHENYGTTIYNFDLKTGSRITLNDVANTESKIYNLVEAIAANLQAKYNKGEPIFKESIYNFPIGPDSAFYYYDSGIVIRFDPYAVAPFSEGVIDVKVPYTTINKANNYIPSVTIPDVVAYPPVTNTDVIDYYTSDVIESKIESDFDGFDEGNIYELSNGQIWRQIDYKYDYNYDYRPEVIIYKDGTRYYMIVEDMDDAVEVERLK